MPGKKQPDAVYLDRLKELQIVPVFVMGLHRSGTTFLYDALSRVMSAAPLTAYHIFHFNSLLANHINGDELDKRAELNQLFKRKNIQTRGIDTHRVSHELAEEFRQDAAQGLDGIEKGNPDSRREYLKLLKKAKQVEEKFLIANRLTR